MACVHDVHAESSDVGLFWLNPVARRDRTVRWSAMERFDPLLPQVADASCDVDEVRLIKMIHTQANSGKYNTKTKKKER